MVSAVSLMCQMKLKIPFSFLNCKHLRCNNIHTFSFSFNLTFIQQQNCVSYYGDRLQNFVTHFIRSSHLELFLKKGVRENFAKFTRKHLCLSLYLIKFQAYSLQFYLKRLWHRCFPVKLARRLLQNTSEHCFCFIKGN